MTKAAAVNTQKIEHRKILTGDLQRAEYARPLYRVIVRDVSTTVEDIQKPEFWINVGAILQGTGQHPFPVVELIWADGSRYVEVLVLAARNLHASVKVLRDIELADETEKRALSKVMEDAPYQVKYINPQARFAVVRASDGERLIEGLATKQEAQEWLTNFEKAR